MASTNQTVHYDLSQYTANDKPTYLVDYNGDMAKIDAGIYGADARSLVNETAIGDLTTLDTTAKNNLVSAINEVNTQVGTNTGNISTNTSNISTLGGEIGTIANLTTTDKTSLVNATNEVNAKVGNLANLSTTDKTSVVDAINEIKGEEKGTVLWTNQDLTQAFNSQTISMDLTDYDVFDIIFAHDTYSTNKLNSIRIIKGEGDLFNGNVTNAAKMEMADRGFSITDSGIQFYDCYYCTLAGQTVATANIRNIPYKIIGYDIH